jgi:hypothetical protein
MDFEIASGAMGRRPSAAPVALTVNRETRVLEVEPRVSLLDAPCEYLLLTGTKKGATRARAAHAPSESRAAACSPA